MTMAGSLPVPHNWINDRFGSKRGLVRYGLFEAKRMLGFYSALKVKRHAPPRRLVFVCVGNICRSPMAEAVAKSKGYDAISYGLNTRGGDGADPRAIKYAALNSLDLTDHKTRRIDEYKFREGDLIVGMEPKHLAILRENYCDTEITLLGLHAKKELVYIHDPYNTNDYYFTFCERIVVEATERLVSHVR